MHHLDRTTEVLDPEADAFESELFEDAFEDSAFEEEADTEFELDEVEEMELATELLSVGSEAELDQFLGKLVRKAGRFMRTPAGRALMGVLKKAARKALPIAGGALGGWIGGPIGAKLGSSFASQAGKAFGLEVEGMSGEDAQFEVARRFVRFAGNAAKTAAAMPPGAPSAAIVRNAVVKAARRHAPGLLGALGSAGARSGRWYRVGRKIVLVGA